MEGTIERPFALTTPGRTRLRSVSLAMALHGLAAVSMLMAQGHGPALPPETATAIELVPWVPPQQADTPAVPTAVPPPASPPQPVARPTPPAVRPAPARVRTAQSSTTPAAAAPAETGTAADTENTSATAPAAPSPPSPSDADEPFVPPNGNAAYLSNPKPAYPPQAQKHGWQGVVILAVSVDENGTPQDVGVKTSSGNAVLDRCAVEAVRQWRFVPARRGGKAVAAAVEVPIRFGLESG